MKGGTPPASPRPAASTSRPRSAASAINRLQEALEGTRDRESHLAERVAASVTDGHRSPHAFLRSFKIVAAEERDITTASRSSVAPFNLRSFEISAVGKGPSGRSVAFLTPSPPGESVTRRDPRQPRYSRRRECGISSCSFIGRGAQLNSLRVRPRLSRSIKIAPY